MCAAGLFIATPLNLSTTSSWVCLLWVKNRDFGGNTVTVALHLPAQPGYAALARNMAASIAARCELTFDRVEDARLAIDEAFNQVVLNAPADAEIVCTFIEVIGALEFMVQSRTLLEEDLPRNTFSWTVLSALANELHTSNVDGILTVVARLQEQTNEAA